MQGSCAATVQQGEMQNQGTRGSQATVSTVHILGAYS